MLFRKRVVEQIKNPLLVKPFLPPKCFSLWIVGFAMLLREVCDGFLRIRHSLEAFVPELLLLLINGAVEFDVTLNQVDKDIIGIVHHRCHCAKALLQKLDELRLAHFATGKGELAMLDRPLSADITVDGNIIGRVGEDHVYPLIAKQS